jgi:hypothetical protein
MMQPFLFKPDNYESWSSKAIEKIELTIESCQTRCQLETAAKMVDNFVLIMVLNETYSQEIVQDISRQLYLCLKLKESRLHG